MIIIIAYFCEGCLCFILEATFFFKCIPINSTCSHHTVTRPAFTRWQLVPPSGAKQNRLHLWPSPQVSRSSKQREANHNFTLWFVKSGTRRKTSGHSISQTASWLFQWNVFKGSLCEEVSQSLHLNVLDMKGRQSSSSLAQSFISSCMHLPFMQMLGTKLQVWGSWNKSHCNPNGIPCH